uniref:Putative secreted protein n=1 Tax=Anopheles marajoara TaxID=58244 RepID=A0A2M4CCT9_9DIPT
MMLLLMTVGSILFLPPTESEIERGMEIDRETGRVREREEERKIEMDSISNRALFVLDSVSSAGRNGRSHQPGSPPWL